MNQKYSIAHLTVLELSPPEMIYMAERVGYDFVSLRTIHLGIPGEPNYALAQNHQLLKETKKAFSKTGVKLLDIELAKVFKDVNVQDYEAEFEVAAELGGKHVLSSIWTNHIEYAAEKFVELCELAKQYNLTVDLEYVPISGVRNLEQAVHVLRLANQPNQGLMIDTHHFHRAGDSLEELVKLPKEWFHFLHLCDAPAEIPNLVEEMTRVLREERLFVGEGGIDVGAIAEAIPSVPFSIELPNVKRIKEMGPELFAKQCLDSAKQYFENREVESTKIS